MTEDERREWNAAVAAGDAETVDRLRDRHLLAIHRRIMDDDPDYREAGWKAER